jgi:general secretion pathway protein K
MKDQRSERGFVLVAVLLGLALLATIALAFSYTSRLEVKSRGHLMRFAETRALADGIVRLLSVRLSDRDFIQQWRSQAPDGAVRACRIDDANVVLTLIDTGGLVDLNAAPAALLEQLLRGIGVDKEGAVDISAAILEFRTTSESASSGNRGNEATAGTPHSPKHALFESASELDQVRGLTPELYARLRPLVTVHSRLPGFDPNAAPLELLALFRGETATAASNSAPSRDELLSSPSLVPMELTVRSTARTFVVRALVVRPDVARFMREAVVEVAPQSLTGIAVRDWSAPAIDTSSAASIQIGPSPTLDCRQLVAMN